MKLVVSNTFIVAQEGDDSQEMNLQNLSSPSRSWRRLSRAYSDGELDYDRSDRTASCEMSSADTSERRCSLPACSEDWEVSSECSVVTEISFPSGSPTVSCVDESTAPLQVEVNAVACASEELGVTETAVMLPPCYHVPVAAVGTAHGEVFTKQQALELRIQAEILNQQAEEMEQRAEQLNEQAEQAEQAQQVRIRANAPWRRHVSTLEAEPLDEAASAEEAQETDPMSPALPPGNWSCAEAHAQPAMENAVCVYDWQPAMENAASVHDYAQDSQIWVDEYGMQWMPVYGIYNAVSAESLPERRAQRLSAAADMWIPASATADMQPTADEWVATSTESALEKGTGKPRVNHSKHTRTHHNKELHHFTTIMLRNCPNDLKRDMLMKVLDDVGFSCCYDFVYLPVDFRRVAGLGYAFVNFNSHANALRAMECFDGFSDWPVESEKICAVSWGEPLQGLKQHLDRYRNSPVMHPDVQERFKPVLLKNGIRQPFPAPTKKIRPPRMKRNGHGVPSSCPGFADSDSEESH